MKSLLEELDACEDAIVWFGDKTFKEAFETCHRGDWMLWLFQKTNPKDLRLLTLAKGHCANTVRHLMTDDRSLKAVDIAIAFGEGRATKEELSDAASAAYSAAASAYAYAAAYAADASASYVYASASAAYSAAASAYASSYAYATYAASASYATAKKENQRETADICRKYLPIGTWNIKSEGL